MKNQKPHTKKQRIIKYSLLGLLGVFGLFVLVAVDAAIQMYLINGKPLPAKEKLITANPVNLKQIAGISKFRSCQGHEYSGKGAEGIVESNRSMKHYLTPLEDLKDKLNTIEIYAPFDGEITFVMPEQKGAQLIMSPEGNKNWGVMIFHVDRLAGMNVGTAVKAGQLLGHANVKDRHDFDIAMTYTSGSMAVEKIAQLLRGSPILPLPKDDYLVSTFDYMTDEVRAEFSTAGFKLDEMAYTRQFRDSQRCDFDKAAKYEGDWQYLPGNSPEELQRQKQEKDMLKQGNSQPANQQTPVQLYP